MSPPPSQGLSGGREGGREGLSVLRDAWWHCAGREGLSVRDLLGSRGTSALAFFPGRGGSCFLVGSGVFWGDDSGGRDESMRHGAESQWIVAARPLCHLQYPVAYLSRLQRILPAARWELYFKAARATRPSRGWTNGTCLWGPGGPYCRSASGRRAYAPLL